MEAQQSGFHWERTSDGMSEPCPLGRGERYEVREDEIGRFKGMGFLREGADSPYQGEMSRRDKRGRVLEIPLPLGSSLVTFCLHRKSLARGRNILFMLSSAIQIDGPMRTSAPTKECLIYLTRKT